MAAVVINGDRVAVFLHDHSRMDRIPAAGKPVEDAAGKARPVFGRHIIRPIHPVSPKRPILQRHLHRTGTVILRIKFVIIIGIGMGLLIANHAVQP